MKKLAKWTLSIVLVVVGLGALPYIVLYVGHVCSHTFTTESVKSPDGQYEAYVEYKKRNWTESYLCIRGKNGRTVRSFPVTGQFDVRDMLWSPDSRIVAVTFRASDMYGRRRGFYGVQAMDTSGRSCENFGDLDVPIDDRTGIADIESWEWTKPRTIRFDLYLESERATKTIGVLFRVIHTSRDFRMVRAGL